VTNNNYLFLVGLWSRFKKKLFKLIRKMPFIGRKVGVICLPVCCIYISFLIVSRSIFSREGWKDGSVVKSTDCPSKGPEFKSQQPHGSSQPSVMRSDALFWCI
jgi:hypothetical protein